HDSRNATAANAEDVAGQSCDPDAVVVTGVGVVSSLGIGADAFWEGMCAGNGGLQQYLIRGETPVAPDGDGDQDPLLGCPVIDFQPKQLVKPRKALKVMSRELQTSFAASSLALDDADIRDYLTDRTQIPADRIGTVYGSEMLYGAPSELTDAVRGCQSADGTIDASMFGGVAKKQVMPLWMLKYLPNMAACHAGIAVDARGPNNTIVVGDTSAMAALIESHSCICRGIADVMMTGSTGSRVNETRRVYRGDQLWPIDVSDSNLSAGDSPQLFAQPDAASGMIPGEGAVTLVLESKIHCQRRQRQPIAEIRGVANRMNAKDPAQAIAAAGAHALHAAGLSVNDIGLVVSHAFGDPTEDAAEARALSQLFAGADADRSTALLAPAAALGHCGAASAGLGMATALMAIRHGQVPMTIGQQAEVPPSLSDTPLRFAESVQPLHGAVLCIAHGRQGTATAMVLSQP
ncbi:MAG: beta-ketoacyl synthase N-terminal-like domain-containing protein, partial [Planctomycetota bacterium]